MSKLHLQFQKRWSKVKVKRVKVTKVVGQGHRVKVKVVKGVLYPIDSPEVRHAGDTRAFSSIIFPTPF